MLRNDIHRCRASGIFLRLEGGGLIAGNNIYHNAEAGVDIRKKSNPLILVLLAIFTPFSGWLLLLRNPFWGYLNQCRHLQFILLSVCKGFLPLSLQSPRQSEREPVTGKSHRAPVCSGWL